MKRTVCILICAAMVLLLCACQTQEPEFEEPVSFYYLRTHNPNEVHHGAADSVIAAEIREGSGINQDITLIIEAYLAGPVSEVYQMAFPSDVKLISWEIIDTTLSVTLSDHLAELSGIDLTLACACLTRTMLDLTDCDTVRIQAENLPLDGKSAVTMNEELLVILDETADGTETKGK